ncbi:MAG: hypothetical protein V4671_19535 [Armatimonadota bacterium]
MSRKPIRITPHATAEFEPEPEPVPPVRKPGTYCVWCKEPLTAAASSAQLVYRDSSGIYDLLHKRCFLAWDEDRADYEHERRVDNGADADDY